MQLTDLNVGVLYILAVSSMGVYGVALAGWASNNKYALLGGLRSSAQMISYELPMSLAIAAPLLVSNSLSLREIVNKQSGSIIHWNIIGGGSQIVGFILFIIAAFAETNRIPFDLPEAENELVAGFHVEYSSMKFASFFMAEYANMVTVSAMASVLFLGGWMAPFPVSWGSNYVPAVIFLLSALALFFHAATRRAPPRQDFLSRVRRSLPSDGRALRLAHRAILADPALLVLRQNRRHSFRIHVDPRYAAALPI